MRAYQWPGGLRIGLFSLSRRPLRPSRPPAAFRVKYDYQDRDLASSPRPLLHTLPAALTGATSHWTSARYRYRHAGDLSQVMLDSGVFGDLHESWLSVRDAVDQESLFHFPQERLRSSYLAFEKAPLPLRCPRPSIYKTESLHSSSCHLLPALTI